MPKNKLQRFAEIKTFSNVIQPDFSEVFRKDHALKGRWGSAYFKNDNPIVLELGCGKGEYTTGLAAGNSDNNYIGIDIKGARIWKGARKALEEEMANVAFIRTRIELINSFFNDSEIDEIWLTFPDPQLKKKRKRLTSSRFLSVYQNFLKHNGLVHLKTDNITLYHYTLDVALRNNLNIRVETEDLYHYHSCMENDYLQIRTFYEQQFLDMGMKINYLCFELPHGKQIREPAGE